MLTGKARAHFAVFFHALLKFSVQGFEKSPTEVYLFLKVLLVYIKKHLKIKILSNRCLPFKERVGDALADDVTETHGDVTADA